MEFIYVNKPGDSKIVSVINSIRNPQAKASPTELLDIEETMPNLYSIMIFAEIKGCDGTKLRPNL